MVEECTTVERRGHLGCETRRRVRPGGRTGEKEDSTKEKNRSVEEGTGNVSPPRNGTYPHNGVQTRGHRWVPVERV